MCVLALSWFIDQSCCQYDTRRMKEWMIDACQPCLPILPINQSNMPDFDWHVNSFTSLNRCLAWCTAIILSWLKHDAQSLHFQQRGRERESFGVWCMVSHSANIRGSQCRMPWRMVRGWLTCRGSPTRTTTINDKSRSRLWFFHNFLWSIDRSQYVWHLHLLNWAHTLLDLAFESQQKWLNEFAQTAKDDG